MELSSQTDIYFDTTHVSAKEFQEWKDKVVGQNGDVLSFFADHAQFAFNAWEVQERLGKPLLITSIRRAINTLLKERWIRQVGDNVGPMGHKNYTYQFRPKSK